MKVFTPSPLICLMLPMLALSLLAQSQPSPVFVEEVKKHAVIETIEALGTLRANESTQLSASVTETVTAVHFEDNQQVKAGDVLLEMTSAEERAQLQEAQSTLREAQRQLGRLKALLVDNLTTESAVDQQQAAADAAAAQLDAVKSRLQDRLVVAPFDGVVGLRNLSVGALVRPGDLITTLDDTSVMKLDVTVPSVHLGKLTTGMEIVAKASALNQQTFTGNLTSIGSRIDPVTRSLTVRARLSNPAGVLRPGLAMTVELKSNARQALTLSEEAVIQSGRTAFVYVVDSSVEPNTVTKRNIQLGLRQNSQVEIISGLKAGELVVIHGGIKLRPGAEVLISAIREDTERLQQMLTQ